VAETNGRIIGSIAIAGHSKVDTQLRWFLVHPVYRGLDIGKELIKNALQFCKKCKYKTIFLWTTSELIEAGHLYTRFGFNKTEEKTHEIWGKKVTEERYDLYL
jgi:N-acetylglutamate synthase-like GNAT family acetyltransferase